MKPFILACLAGLSVALSLSTSVTYAQINGFTEPYRQIELASDESGTVYEMMVQEGTRVSEGDVIAQLDDRVQQLQVESANHLLNSMSAREAARRTLTKRELITARIRELIETGHATESELIRAELEQSIARAKFAAAEEEAMGREIDLRRAQLMLERRQIKAPFDAVVAEIHCRKGEFLSPMRPEVVTLIQIDRLLAVFNVPSSDVELLKQRSKLSVSFPNGNQVEGELYSIGVQTDAESGTVQVKVELENPDGLLRSGEQCYLTY